MCDCGEVSSMSDDEFRRPGPAFVASLPGDVIFGRLAKYGEKNASGRPGDTYRGGASHLIARGEVLRFSEDPIWED